MMAHAQTPMTTLRQEWRLAGLAFLFFALLLLPPLVSLGSIGELVVEDDAYYYFIIARNIAEQGRSTFDGQSLTNGFHPLWQLLMVAQHVLAGPSILVTSVLEAALLTGALAITLWLSGNRSIAGWLISATVVIVLLRNMTMRGMETSLVIFCFALLLAAVARCDRERETDTDRAAVLTGLAAAAAIGARLDAAFFVVPLLLLAISGRRRLVALAVLGGLGVIYASINVVVFGSVLPVSAKVKSLGGLQINWLLIDQIRQLHLVDAGKLVAVGVTCALLGTREASGTWQRAALLAIPIGLVLFCAKLLFGSSWRIWDWYFYPLVLGAITIVATHIDRGVAWLEERNSTRIAVPLAAGYAVAMTATFAFHAAKGDDYTNFRHISRMAIERYAGVLGGAPVAMGDRAGSFAAAYKGPVVQTEGLVNDRQYIDTLAAGGDVRGLLCRRGAKFVAAFSPDLGDYRTHAVPTLNPIVASFAAPAIRVERRDEVGRVFDLARYDTSTVAGGGDSYLYIWRLSGC